MKVLPHRVLLFLLVTLACKQAVAHEVRPAFLDINETAPNQFEIDWKQPSIGTAMLHLKPELSNGLLDIPWDEEYVTDSFVIRRWKMRPIARESLEGVTVRIDGLERTATDTLVIIDFATGHQIQKLLRPDSPAFVIHLVGAGGIPVAAYLTLGIEHILAGFDHLCFVLCLVLLIRGLKPLFKTVSAFTVAHSITLAAAALGWIQLSAPLVESLVALSISFVAVELVKSWQGEASITARYPWLIAFTFGLLHGFAFAGSLAEVGLPASNIPGALVLFNCGVEIGQGVFVVAVLALVRGLRGVRLSIGVNKGRRLVPYAIGTLASYWMFERISMFIL